jgi:hypothetical protein
LNVIYFLEIPYVKILDLPLHGRVVVWDACVHIVLH